MVGIQGAMSNKNRPLEESRQSFRLECRSSRAHLVAEGKVHGWIERVKDTILSQAALVSKGRIL